MGEAAKTETAGGKHYSWYGSDAKFTANTTELCSGSDNDVQLYYHGTRVHGEFVSFAYEGAYRYMGLWQIYLGDSNLHGWLTSKAVLLSKNMTASKETNLANQLQTGLYLSY